MHDARAEAVDVVARHTFVRLGCFQLLLGPLAAEQVVQQAREVSRGAAAGAADGGLDGGEDVGHFFSLTFPAFFDLVYNRKCGRDYAQQQKSVVIRSEKGLRSRQLEPRSHKQKHPHCAGVSH